VAKPDGPPPIINTSVETVSIVPILYPPSLDFGDF
jgi:hypothetical protein